MTLALRYWPDKVLGVKCKPICEIDDDVRALAREMLQLMQMRESLSFGPARSLEKS
jgi:peptide deformylase